jgi:multidrug efflux pump subunit AcrA (membrane-fusion protein)
MTKHCALYFVVFLLMASCRQNSETGQENPAEGRTPVTVTHITTGSLTDSILLNATSRFLLKTSVKSEVNGYLRKVNIQLGQKVSQGEEIFEIRSKESEHLGNTISKLDTSFHFSGLVHIKSPAPGYVTSLAYQAGDYVQDNEVLATISDLGSLVFLLELPYELTPWLAENKTVDLTLPDGKKYRGTINSSMPEVDPVSQTQSYVIRVPGISSIPENLAATVRFKKTSRSKAVILPKSAILSDETQSDFWIMKLVDSSTAVKVPVTVGLVTSGQAEILEPVLEASDQVLVTGNYGLPDTARVIIENKH